MLLSVIFLSITFLYVKFLSVIFMCPLFSCPVFSRPAFSAPPLLLSATQPSYRRKLIFFSPLPGRTRSSPVITISATTLIFLSWNHKSLSSSRCLWNQLPASFRQPHPNHSPSHFSQPTHVIPSLPSLLLSSSITPTLFRSTPKSRPNNLYMGLRMSIRPSVRPYDLPSAKSLCDSDEIWYV